MVKRIITSFLIFGAFVAQSFAQEKIYVWEKDGTVTEFTVKNIDSISITAPKITISFNNNGVITQGNPVMAIILAPGQNISSIDLFKGTSKIDTYTNIDQAGDNYYLAISDLTSGVYTLVVNGLVTVKKDFTVISFSTTPQYETFTANLGGTSAAVGSFLSISKKAVYVLSQISTTTAQDVQVVFNGTELMSPHYANNGMVSTNGITTTFNGSFRINIGSGGKYNFETSTGLKGYINIDSVTGSGASTTISVTVEVEKK